MADYIRRDIVLQIINTVNDTGGFAGYADYCVLFDEIDTMPAADVQPVKHGRWIIMDDVEHFIAVCSECGRTEDSRAIKDMPYCHCGARMDGDTNG